MHKRVFGTECEYAPVYHGGPSASLSSPPVEAGLGPHENLAEALLSGIGAKDYPRAGEFLGNGGRLYVDRGGHPEYATPECASVKDLVIHEKAGDRIIQELAELTRVGGGLRKLHVYKNNVDGYGHTYGNHENYLITSRAMATSQRLIPFLVTRQIYAGAGKVYRRPDMGRLGFQISQRADFFNRTISDRTAEVRGILNPRKREIVDHGENRRLHLIVGDNNMSQWTLGLKVGTTVMMLRLLEEGGLNGSLSLEDPVAALKKISRSYDAGVRVSHQGRKADYSALEIQTLLLEKALRFYEVNGCDAETAELLSLWEKTLGGLKTLKLSLENIRFEEDPGEVKRKIDWVLKLWLLDRGCSRGADERRLRYLDMKYHDLDPETGLFERCGALGMADEWVSEAQILQARRHAPPDTRAHLRGEVIQAAFTKNVDVTVKNWETIHLMSRQQTPVGHHPFNRLRGRLNQLEIQLADPFLADDPKLMESLGEFLGSGT
ncbi:MAG: proteasome accessory factor PafA2 family protein [Pseudomonadota bacterium]